MSRPELSWSPARVGSWSPARVCPSSADLPISAAMALEKLVYRVKVAADRAGERDGADGRAEPCPVLAALPVALRGRTAGSRGEEEEEGERPSEISGNRREGAGDGERAPAEGTAAKGGGGERREAGAAVQEGGAGGRAQPIRGTRPFFGVSLARRWGDAAAPSKGRASRGERPARSGPESRPCRRRR